LPACLQAQQYNFQYYPVKEDGLALYIGARNGMSVYDGRTFKNYFVSKDENIKVTAFHWYQDKLLVGTSLGVFEFDGTRFKYAPEFNGKRRTNIHCDQKGQIWIATQDKGISIWNPKDSIITEMDAENGLCNNNVQVILEDSWGGIWIATSGGGICKYTGQQFLHRDISERPADNLVYALSQDSSGMMWFAAADDGVVRLDSGGYNYTRFGGLL